MTTNEKEQPIWDIMLIGHGTYKSPIHIGGLESSDMQQILTFFTRIPTATFYLASCFAGGKNIDLLQFEKAIDDRYIKPLNYILIVAGVTDAPIFIERAAQQFFHGFFDLAAKREGKGKMLDNLLVAINTMNIDSGSPHGAANIPQVWLPGGLGFQTFNIDKRVASLGPVKVRVHEEENKPINLPNTTRAVLLYTGSIKAPIKAGLAQFHEKMTQEKALEKELLVRKAAWENLPSVVELIYELQKDLAKANKKEFPTINQLNAKGISSEDKIHEAINFLYPQFISMIHGDAKHHFKKIEVKPSPEVPKEFTGVMHFIRDAFLEAAGRITTKKFVIDELTGNNDISLLLELGRLESYPIDPSEPLEEVSEEEFDFEFEEIPDEDVKENEEDLSPTQPHPLEELLKEKINQPITLKNVQIKTHGKTLYGKTITFEYGGITWGLHAAGDIMSKLEDPAHWNFEKWSEGLFDAPEEKEVTPLKKQKTITEILIERAARIKALQKAREKKGKK